MRPVINSVKHYVHQSPTGSASGALSNFILVDTIARGATVTAAAEVEEGAIIKACYVEFWVKADNPNFSVSVALLKRPANVTNVTAANLVNMGAYPNKKNVFEFHQGLVPSGDQTLAVFRGWYKIPKGKQRFGLGDKLSIALTFTGSAGDFCGFTTYKEYQ